MKKSILFILLVSLIGLSLSGCMGTKNYYDAQTAYYNAQKDASIAYTKAMNARPPIAQMVAPDGTVFTVNQTGAITSPVIRITENPIVAGLKTVVNSTPLAIVAGGWSAKELLKSSSGDVYASDNAHVTTTSNSNNATDLRNADGDISEDNSNNSTNDSNNAVADPTIVEQPAYNDPIVIEQPDYNDPIIVDPVIVKPEVIQPGGTE
jgi:outer membrane lipoprotein SlyB